MTNSTRSAIEAAIRDYVEGWYEGDTARMDRALHDDLAKRTRVVDDDGVALRSVSKGQMVDLTGAGGGESPGADHDIEIHHVADTMACASVRSLEYLDYLHLAETDDGWRIVNILFRTLE